MTIELRFEGETDEQFRGRAERAAVIAKVLVRAALENRCVQEMIADSSLPYTEESIRRHPPVRVEYEQAVVMGDIGSCLSSAKGKNWGEGPWIMPLERDDPVHPQKVLYLYRENCVYNRRFVQRQELKRLLGREHRSLVTKAKRATQRDFIAELSEAQVRAIHRRFGVGPKEFWRAVRGKAFLELPAREQQQELEFPEQD